MYVECKGHVKTEVPQNDQRKTSDGAPPRLGFGTQKSAHVQVQVPLLCPQNRCPGQVELWWYVTTKKPPASAPTLVGRQDTIGTVLEGELQQQRSKLQGSRRPPYGRRSRWSRSADQLVDDHHGMGQVASLSTRSPYHHHHHHHHHHQPCKGRSKNSNGETPNQWVSVYVPSSRGSNWEVFLF